MADRGCGQTIDALALMMLAELGKVHTKLDLVLSRIDHLQRQFDNGCSNPKSLASSGLIIEASVVDDNSSRDVTPQTVRNVTLLEVSPTAERLSGDADRSRRSKKCNNVVADLDVKEEGNLLEEGGKKSASAVEEAPAKRRDDYSRQQIIFPRVYLSV